MSAAATLETQARSFWQRVTDTVDVQALTTQAIAFVPKLIAAVLTLCVFLLISKGVRNLLRGLMHKTGMQEALIQLIVDKILRYALLMLGVVMAADQLGINIAAALAGLGIAGVAVGFAAQDSVANMISGIIIFWDKPFIVGDWVRVDDQFGKVSEITLRSTRIKTPRNTWVVVPNKQIIDAVLENLSKRGDVRVDLPIGIAYKEKIDEARPVLLAAVRDLDHVLKSPEPDVVATELGDSSVNLLVRVWIAHPKDLQSTSFAVVEASKRALDAAGIEIPFPHLQLFLDGVRPEVWSGAKQLAAR